ncbi:DUF305 domain-containing protein [Streptomyces sp900105755]|uniref:DUF305 domain-containing protein n=1 Tax=Streptomyces sp. 900105755 TaxID=3154389 RepID=UPI003318D56D
MTSTRTRAVLVALTATAALALTACGSGDDGAGTAPASHSAAAGATNSADAHNAQDVSFAQSMIPHHQQALEMAGLAVDRGSSAQVRSLAARIEKAQDPEIRTMTGWLKAWGEDVPMAGMDHSGHAGMAGMMSDKDMTTLKQAKGTDFDTMFLTMMVEHHRGAVEMAGTEKAKGSYGPATAMADAIVTAQNAEIKEMNKLLGKG